MSLQPAPSINLLSVLANLQRHQLSSGDPFLLLADLQYPGALNPTATQYHLRLARNTDDVTFDANDGNGPQVYTAFNFSVGEYQQGSDGRVQTMELQASNVMRVLQPLIEQYRGLTGANLTLYAVNPVNALGEPDLTLSFQVVQVSCDSKLVHFKLGAPSPLRRLFPIFMYRPNDCIWQYRSAQCGYVGKTATATLVSGSLNLTITGGSAAGVTAGYGVSGTGIPADATVASTYFPLSGDPVITLSTGFAATASATGVSLTFFQTSCSKTLDGTTGCEAHNNQARFGGFPGIDTNDASTAVV
jgi:phage-related protein